MCEKAQTNSSLTGNDEHSQCANLKDDALEPVHRPNVLLAVTGSVAGIKGPELAVHLVKVANAHVRVLLTRGGKNFWTKAKDYNLQYWDEMSSLLETGDKQGRIEIIDSDDEWKDWNELGDPVLHIQLREWADVLVIAPLSAHTLAKLSHGLCDDTLSCVVRAWDFGHGPRPGKALILAPAMNTAMYEHPLTLPQLKTIQSFWNDQRCPKDPNGVVIVPPQVKVLACGEVGVGALAPVDQIVASVMQALRRGKASIETQVMVPHD